MREFYPRFCAAYVCCMQENSILLLRRKNTGFKDGEYTVPAGHIEPHERPTEAAIRELREEVGIIVEPQDIHCFHVGHRISDTLDKGETELRQYIDFFFVTRKWHGNLLNMEPEKCDDMQWFALQSIPENTIYYEKLALEHLEDDVLLSEW